MNPPLILTLKLDKYDLDYFTALRQKHFPPEQNFIDAHLTLFHALPNQPIIIETGKEVAGNNFPFTLAVNSLVSIGNGVAFKIESRELLQLHKGLQSAWLEFLSPQDRQKLWPHITVQNKVPAAQASTVLAELSTNFQPFMIEAKGLELWEYLNGPWRMVDHVDFRRGS